VSLWSDDERDAAEVDRAPICETCGVTMLPATPGIGFDTEWECANPECEASN
jgi:hypothetical protein